MKSLRNVQVEDPVYGDGRGTGLEVGTEEDPMQIDRGHSWHPRTRRGRVRSTGWKVGSPAARLTG